MTLVIFNKSCIASGHVNQYEQTVTVNGQTSYQSVKHISELFVYNLSQQKRFFVNVTLISSMAHYRLMTFACIATVSSSNRHLNSYLVAQKCSRLFLVQTVIYVKNSLRNKDDLSVAKGLKLPDLILSLLWLLKTHRGYKTYFSDNVTLCNPVTFKF